MGWNQMNTIKESKSKHEILSFDRKFSPGRLEIGDGRKQGKKEAHVPSSKST